MLFPRFRRGFLPLTLLFSFFLTPSLGVAGPFNPIEGYNTWRQSRALARAAEGLESKLEKSPVLVASELYLLEIRALTLLESIGNRGGSEVKRNEALSAQRSNIRRILRLSERVRKYAIEKADEVLTPEPDRQLSKNEEGVDLYKPIYRGLPERKDGKERTGKEAIQLMENAQRKKGIDTSQVHNIGADSMAQLESGQLAEWVQLAGSDRIIFSKDGAKHPIMARGKEVRGAGSFKLFKNKRGEVLLAIVSPTSGNYKPGPGSTEALVQSLAKAGIPEGRIMVTETAPADTSTVKLLMRVMKHSKEQIKTRINKLERYNPKKKQRTTMKSLLSMIPRPRMTWKKKAPASPKKARAKKKVRRRR